MDIHALLVLTRIPKIGPTRLRALLQYFKNPEDISRAPRHRLVAVEGIEQITAGQIQGFFRSPAFDEARCFADDQMRRLKRAETRIVTLWDEEYPALLRKIDDPPPLLFVRGRLQESDASALAIVGTREPTPYGTRMAATFAEALARLGLTVVSGLARGVDTRAHQAAVTAGGRSIAVIGSGIDVMYPPENTSLANRISCHGAVISEYPMGTPPDAGNFPRRNRIISGLSLGTIVVETGPDGGAMITATCALEQNREVFAIPASVSDRAASGTNLLIKEGKAKLTESIDDILIELSTRLRNLTPALPQKPLPADLNLFERSLLDHLREDPVHIDQLAENAGMPVAEALIHLLSLECKGIARQRPGKYFVRS